MNATETVLQKLDTGEFEGLIGMAESEWLEAKESPYPLDTPRQKLELAKDVVALANANGGIIVVGFDTERHPTTAAEQISKVCPFPLERIDPNRYTKILNDMVHPPLHDVQVRPFEKPAGGGKGVAAIIVGTAAERPCLVGKMLDENGQSIGAYFGLFERRQDIIPPVSIARIQQQIAAGRQWASVDQRLLAIETQLAAWPAPLSRSQSNGIAEDERLHRLAKAAESVQRRGLPFVYFMATADSQCDFPTLFKSRAERIVRLIENPPQLRDRGFEIWADRASEIIEGRLRRNMIAGFRLIELWQDGLFTYIAPGNEDFLGWRMGRSDKPIHISNFVLAESILAFCWLTKFIFDEANPQPDLIRLVVGFDNLTRVSGPATLSFVPEGKMHVGSHLRQAPAAKHEVHQPAERSRYDAERLAFLLMADIYNWFGFDAMSMPYITPDESGAKLSSMRIVGRELPGEIETPGYF